MDGGQEWEVSWQPPNKTPITAAVTVAAVRNAEGTPIGFRWILRDITQRKRIESELHKTNDRFQLVAAASDSLIYHWDIENRTVDRTEGLVNILGYRPDEAEPTPSWWTQHIHPDDRQRVRKVVKDALTNSRNYELEYRILDKSDRYRYVWDKGLILRNAAGKAVRVVGCTSDISDRKQTEAALREIEQRLHAILDNTPMSVFLKDLQVGNNFRDWEWELTCKDGQVKTISWFNISERFPIPGWKAWAVGVDITERKNAEEALRVSEVRFRQLAENIREVFWMITPDSTQTMYISPAYEEMWGRTCESLYQDAMSWLEAVHPDDRDRVFAALEPLKAGEYNQEYRIVRPDGLVRWIRDRGFPVRDAQGRICCVAGIAEDITSQKLTEAEIEQALQTERELSELKSQFISIASHEFRTPLTTISTSAELLERYRHRFSEEKQLTHLHRIQTAVGQMAQLLDDVLLIGKAGAGKLEFNPTPLDLVQFCADLVAELQLTVKTQHEITFTHQDDCTFAAQDASESNGFRLLSSQSLPLLDEKLLRHIFGNLLSNAIKYSPSGSTVHFKLTCLDDSEALLRSADRAIFQVQDQGIGIPLEDQPRLFESFHRASNVGTIQGTGLGLAIVKQCVELQRGQISVESVVGKGTTFTINLPLNFGKPSNF